MKATIGEILEMSKHGFEFIINDGKLVSVVINFLHNNK